ncbi:MAG: acetolactate decarboxylase [Pseudomonadota bacterium]
MKIFRTTFALLMLVNGIPAMAQGPDEPADTLYQVSTLAALMTGDYEGRVEYRTVLQQGDFGLGTFAALDGEMVAVDGEFYQVRANGIATPVMDDQLTPFAIVTHFRADDSFRVSGPVTCSELYLSLKERFPREQHFYAIRVTGRFPLLRTRSVSAQDKPYPPLAEALKQQVVFDFSQAEATLVGFWFPPIVAEVNVAGFHFHAIMTDIGSGGHVLDCEVEEAKVEIDRKAELRVQFADEVRLRPPPPVEEPASRRESPSALRW